MQLRARRFRRTDVVERLVVEPTIGDRLVAALRNDVRDALVLIAEESARLLDKPQEPDDRRAQTRVLLAVLRDLESLDSAREREARLASANAPASPTAGATDVVGELIAERAA